VLLEPLGLEQPRQEQPHHRRRDREQAAVRDALRDQVPDDEAEQRGQHEPVERGRHARSAPQHGYEADPCEQGRHGQEECGHRSRFTG
jgi:hypothetical protein